MLQILFASLGWATGLISLGGCDKHRAEKLGILRHWVGMKRMLPWSVLTTGSQPLAWFSPQASDMAQLAAGLEMLVSTP